jgi:hypothetical protein
MLERFGSHTTPNARVEKEKELERGRRAKPKQTLDMPVPAESAEHNLLSSQGNRARMKRRSTDTVVTKEVLIPRSAVRCRFSSLPNR